MVKYESLDTTLESNVSHSCKGLLSDEKDYYHLSFEIVCGCVVCTVYVRGSGSNDFSVYQI